MSEHECIVCGYMHDPERAEQAERALAERGTKLSNKAAQITELLRHQEVLDEHIDTLRATLARVEGEREGYLHNAEVVINALTAERDGWKQLCAQQERPFPVTHREDQVREERDSVQHCYALLEEERQRIATERDGLRAQVEEKEHHRRVNELAMMRYQIEADGLRAALEGLLAEWRGLKLNEVPATVAADAALGRSVNNDPTGGV